MKAKSKGHSILFSFHLCLLILKTHVLILEYFKTITAALTSGTMGNQHKINNQWDWKCLFLGRNGDKNNLMITFIKKGFPGGSEGKAFACNAGDLGSIPGLGRSPGEGNGNPL